MELFDTHFVWFDQVSAVSGLKMLVPSNRYVQVQGVAKIAEIYRYAILYAAVGRIAIFCLVGANTEG